MSEIPGYTLEAYIEWNHNKINETLIKAYEPHREAIENWLSDFNPDEQSWRDYGSYCPVQFENTDSMADLMTDLIKEVTDMSASFDTIEPVIGSSKNALLKKNKLEITKAKCSVAKIISNTNWNMTMFDPSMACPMVEAKASLINTLRKLDKIDDWITIAMITEKKDD